MAHQAYGLSENLGIPVEDAKNFIDKYFETYKKKSKKFRKKV